MHAYARWRRPWSPWSPWPPWLTHARCLAAIAASTLVCDCAQEAGGTRKEPRFRVAWDDGDAPTWLAPAKMVLAYRQPLPAELRPGMACLALFEGLCSTAGAEGDEEDEEQTDVWFPATVVKRHGGPSSDKCELTWDDGHETFVAPCNQLRTFLSHTPLKVRAEKPNKPKHSRAKKREANEAAEIARAIAAAEAAERSAAQRAEARGSDLLRRSGRDVSRDVDPSDPRLLRLALAEFKAAWAGKEPSGAWKVDGDAGGVRGLTVVHNFLNEAEVEALRTVYGAHRAWLPYAYGPGYEKGLASVVQRLDFGPREIRPEGLVSGVGMLRLGSARAEVLSMLGERLRHLCASVGLWAATQPDTLQLTKMELGQSLAPHYDRRDRWQEGLATIGWSALPAENDLRGDPWALVLERGASKKEHETVRIEMEAGSAYVLAGAAQGATTFCERRAVGQRRCHCCWVHGETPQPGTLAPRQSMTLRVLADSDDESDDDDDDDDVEDDDK